MNDLIKALQIFHTYGDSPWPTHCEHDIMYISTAVVHPDDVSVEDKNKLADLGFNFDDEHFYSYQFGSA